MVTQQQAKATGCSSAKCSVDDAVNKEEVVAFQNAKRQKMKKAGVSVVIIINLYSFSAIEHIARNLNSKS